MKQFLCSAFLRSSCCLPELLESGNLWQVASKLSLSSIHILRYDGQRAYDPGSAGVDVALLSVPWTQAASGGCSSPRLGMERMPGASHWSWDMLQKICKELCHQAVGQGQQTAQHQFLAVKPTLRNPSPWKQRECLKEERLPDSEDST